MFSRRINIIKKRKKVKSLLNSKLLIAIEVIRGTNAVVRDEIVRNNITVKDTTFKIYIVFEYKRAQES